MNKSTSANTLRFQDVNLGQEGLMEMDNAGMVTPECAFISKQEGVKRGTTVIFIMEGGVSTTTGVIGSMILMETGETIQMMAMSQEIFKKEVDILLLTIVIF